MKEKQKTKKQLPEEASELQRRMARLEKSNTMLRKDRDALKEIEHRFQLIAENIQEVFWIRDLKKNKTLYVSPAFEKVFGLTRESLYEDSDSYKKIIHPDDLDVLNRANERRRKGIYTDIQYRITRPDGQLRWINSRTFPISNEDKQIHQTVGIAHDITERKQTEEALQQSEERYRTIIDEMDEGYQEVDLAGNFTFFNEAFLKIFGYSRDEIMGTNYSMYAAEEEIAKKVYRAYNHMFKTGLPLNSFEWDIIRKDGARRTLEFYASLLRDSQDRPAGFRGIVRDVTDSRKAEEALRESEERFRTLIELTSDLVYRVDTGGLFIYVNPMFEKVTGHTASELKGLPFTAIIAPELRETIVDLFRKGIGGERIPAYESEIMSRDGTRTPVEFMASTIHDKDGKPTGRFGIGRDITERKRLEENLISSEKKYRNLVDNTLVGVYQTNPDGRILYANQAFSDMFGYDSPEELMSISVISLYKNKEDRKKFLEAIRKERKLLNYDLELVTKDGEARDIILSGALDGDSILGTLVDITERKRAEEILRESEEKYRTILESTEEGYFEVDMAGNFTFFNQSLSRMLGYTEEEMRGMNNRAYMDQETSRKVFRAFNETYRTGVIMKYIDWELIRKDGSRVKVETSVSLRRNSSGDPVGFRGLVRDITERKRAEEALKKAFQNLQETKDMLVQSEKLAAMGRLSSGAAHEIRNPLNILSLNLQMLDIKGKLDDETRKAVDVCHTQIDRIVKIIEGLQTFSRTSKKKLSPENIQEVIDHVLSLSAPRLKVEDVTTGVRCNTDLPQIFMDRAAMEQVFFHLISNALDAMKDREKKVLKISAERKGDALLVTFSDTGHGIREDNLPKLFEPFFTTKDPDKGTGLGLSISYGIIQDHKGKIRAENNETGGSSFYIELPI